MGTIFMISPSFLDAAFTEAKKYDFVLQGYGSFKMGVQGLVKINVIDLLGIVLLVENEKQIVLCSILKRYKKEIFLWEFNQNMSAVPLKVLDKLIETCYEVCIQ